MRADVDLDLGARLLRLSRGWIAHAFGAPSVDVPPDPRLDEPGATFVTLTRRSGDLHGCIGSLEPRRSLCADVRANTLAAAFLDPRSAPLAAHDLPDVVIEISRLGPLARIDDVETEEAAIAALRPFHDGVVLSWGPIRGVLLPQVWERVPDPKTFLACLKRKAGLPHAFWSKEVELRRFSLVKWREGADAPLTAAPTGASPP